MRKAVSLIAVAACVGASLPLAARADDADKILRVCADPNNMPLSNQKQEGYENKIADLLAKELGWKLEYTWFPQRMGFIRNTLRARDPNSDAYKCDLVIGWATGAEMAATTKPYLRSTFAMVYVKGKGLDSITTPNDLLNLPPEQLAKLRLGAFAQSAPVDWLVRSGLTTQIVPYRTMSGDPANYPGEIVERDLVDGKIDAAFVWGPIAGYFGKKVTAAEIVVVPFKPQPTYQFDYSISMGVRYGEKEWKDRIEKLIDANRARIQDILASYNVPQLDEAGNPIAVRTVAGGAKP
ncbi:MAG: quinoprotein dehydrogenase-associated putative ABC transporter substrate-binding protein [Sterolibacteriaceae bacterium]|nr:quinoprotein dehydrogenase-associated putative ABC transporter substrate-binding protein [Sterolibacteriaceae bacterium]MBK9084331.1 quinoprotein dehydrogenase-associated putative ABC transporter substrate-binding protein [Sterolibacteriaceae bacterium]